MSSSSLMTSNASEKKPVVYHRAPRPENYQVVQWETASFYTFESEIDGQPVPDGVEPPPFTRMKLGISRLGSSKGTARCQWSTFDMSASAGVHYIEVKPTWVEFKDGESLKDVTLDILPAESYDGTVELGVYIDEKSVEGAVVGKYLHTASIKIIDMSSFPTDDLKEFVTGGNEEKILSIRPAILVKEFVEVCWSLPLTKMGTKKMIWAHQYTSMVSILNIFILFYLVQVTTSQQLAFGVKHELVVMFSILWVLPFTGVHYLAYRRQFWKVGGSLRKWLQGLLLKKFLNFTQKARTEIGIQKVIQGMMQHVTIVVSDGYLATIDLLFGSLVRICLLILAMIVLQSQSAAGINPIPIAGVFILPICILPFLMYRQKKTFSLRGACFDADEGSISHVLMSVLNYQLIADYDRRTYCLQQFADKINQVNKAATNFNAAAVNSKFFAPWISTVLVGIYIIFGGFRVIEDPEKELAAFLATISIFRSIGGQFEQAYVETLKITSAYASICEITVFINQEIDVPQRHLVTRARRAMGREIREARIRQLKSGEVVAEPDDVAADTLPIQMHDVSFDYQGRYGADQAGSAGEGSEGGGISEETKEMGSKMANPMLGAFTNRLLPSERSEGAVAAAEMLQRAYRAYSFIKAIKRNIKGGNSVEQFRNVNLDIKQGQLVAILGKPNQGKATMMRLIAGQVFPLMPPDSPGLSPVFVPPHLRVVQIQENPFILGPEESIFDNLIYGIKKSPSLDMKALEARARMVMARLELTEDLVTKHFKEKNFVGNGGARITRGDRQLISIGRALVMNPEIIIVHKPTALLDNYHTDLVLKVFREYVENRGVGMPKDEPLIKRRKRTLVFSAKDPSVAYKADVVYEAVKARLVCKTRAEFEEDEELKRKLATLTSTVVPAAFAFNENKW